MRHKFHVVLTTHLTTADPICTRTAASTPTRIVYRWVVCRVVRSLFPDRIGITVTGFVVAIQ